MFDKPLCASDGGWCASLAYNAFLSLNLMILVSNNIGIAIAYAASLTGVLGLRTLLIPVWHWVTHRIRWLVAGWWNESGGADHGSVLTASSSALLLGRA